MTDIIAPHNEPVRSNADEIAATRRAMRQTALAEREGRSEAERAAWSEALTAHLEPLIDALAPGVLGFCWPYRGEPDLRAFVSRWLGGDARRRAVLPVVVDKAQPMVFRRWRPEEALIADRYGIPIPPDAEALAPDVVLVPLNAFDGRGFRIGYGGGYFDRTLEVMDSLAIGVGFEIGRRDSVLPQPHDRPMRWVVTEAGVFAPVA